MLAPNKEWTVNRQAAWVLRNTTLRQTHKVGGEHAFCAIRAIARELGLRPDWMKAAEDLGWNYMQMNAVIRANDRHRWTFPMIANLVETFDDPQWYHSVLGKAMTSEGERRKMDVSSKGMAQALATV